MSLNRLSPQEIAVVRRAMEASLVLIGPGFHARIGLNEDAMRDLLAKWPNVDDSDDKSFGCLAINNCLNDLLYGVGITEAQAEKHVGVSRAEMRRIYEKWAAGRNWSNTGVR